MKHSNILPKDIDFLKDLNIIIKPSKYIRPPEYKIEDLTNFFRLCFFNSPFNNNKKYLKKGVTVYGKVFYLHYELRQLIRDNYHDHYQEDMEKLRATLEAQKENLIDKQDKLFSKLSEVGKPKHPVDKKKPEDFDHVSNYLSSEVTVKANLKKVDKKTDEVPELFSELLISLLNDAKFDPYERALTDYENDAGFLKDWVPTIRKAYFAMMLVEIFGEMLQEIEINGEFKSRKEKNELVDACRDFIRTHRDTSLSITQQAYLVRLHYSVKKRGEFSTYRKLEKKDKESIKSTLRSERPTYEL